jgi:perosamine synthetase
MQNKIIQVMPNIDSNELKHIIESIDNKWLTEGPKSQQFLDHIKEFTGSKFAVLAPNGTLGLFLGLLALDLPKGSEILIPNFTFFASASSAIFAGLKPVFVDVDADTFNMDASKIESLITDNTSAIMPVHIYGHSANMRKIMTIANKHNLKVIEDAAQAYGVSYEGQHCGTFGDVSMISFFADKTITMGEGAVVLTQNKDLYEKLLLLRNQGRPNSGTFIHPSLGMNFRVTDMQSGVGLAQSSKFTQVLKGKLEKYNLYRELLENVGDLEFLKVENNSTFVPFRFFLKTKFKDELSIYLEEANIQTRSFFYPMHKQPPLMEFISEGQEFPISEKLYENGMCLPLHSYLKDSDIRYIAKNIKQFFRER